MQRAALLSATITVTLLIAFACRDGTDPKPPRSAEPTRVPTAVAPIPYVTIGSGDACNAGAVRPDLDPFYCWAVDVSGVVVVASAAVDPGTVDTAAETVAEMLAFRQDVRERLAGRAPRIIIVGQDEPITAAPDLRHMSSSDLYDGRSYHSLRGWSGGVLAALGEEGVVGLAPGDLLVHEFAHVIHSLGLSANEWTASHTLYSRSRAEGRWQDTYAGRNYFEFFAELTQVYFGVKDISLPSGESVDGPVRLREYDPEAADFLERVYGPR